MAGRNTHGSCVPFWFSNRLLDSSCYSKKTHTHTKSNVVTSSICLGARTFGTYVHIMHAPTNGSLFCRSKTVYESHSFLVVTCNGMTSTTLLLCVCQCLDSGPVRTISFALDVTSCVGVSNKISSLGVSESKFFFFLLGFQQHTVYCRSSSHCCCVPSHTICRDSFYSVCGYYMRIL